MFRLLILVHRYLGIALGLLLALWCLSAIVMMYVQFPDLSEREYLAGLSRLDATKCCQLKIDPPGSLQNINEIVIEMMGGTPILRVDRLGQSPLLFDLHKGTQISSIDLELAKAQAQNFFENSGLSANAVFQGKLERDQWTVSGGFNPLRPFYLFAAGNDAGSQIYVSSVNGKLVQDTTRNERLFNWFGAVTHWIYPTVLRQHTLVWSNVVIWTTIAALLLVLGGIYIGICQFGKHGNDRLTPYRGAKLWHHYSGLIFGLLTLMWLTSGLFSMNPWSFLEADAGATERAWAQGTSIEVDDIKRLLRNLPDAELPAATVRLRSAPFDGKFAVLAYDSKSRVNRLNGVSLKQESLPADAWIKLPQLLKPDTTIHEAGWINDDDRYYFSHHQKLIFPAYRIVFNDEEQTRYYFEPNGGQLIAKVDRNRRWYRWLFQALHRGDFSRLIRTRPLWDILMLPLLLGVTIGAVTGAYLGIRRLLR